MRKFLKFVHDDNVYCKYYEVFYILFHTGLRISEFCGLTIKDIDLKNRIINIDHALIQYGISRKEFNQVDIAGVFDLLVFAYQGVRMYSQLMNIDDSVPEKIIEQIKKILIKEG